MVESQLPFQRKLLFGAITLALVLGGLELSSRAYWSITHDVSVFDTLELEHAFYRELQIVEDLDVRRDDGYFDVLVLGASVLNGGYGDVPGALDRALAARYPGPFRVHNLSVPGHMSRDSLNKYRRLEHQRFDAVFLYHSINEIRANNVPPARFRDDYSHMTWYREVNFILAHESISRIFTLPFTLQVAWVTLLDGLAIEPAIGTGRPHQDYIDNGRDVRSAATLESNVREILELARGRGEPILLGRYAWYLPADYSLERFRARELDYRYERRFVPLEVFGRAENVEKGLLAHDAVLRRLGAAGLADGFLDVPAAVPQEGRYWSDVCHLSDEGAERFAAALAEALVALPGATPAP